MVGDFDTLRTHVANYAARCAEKLRRQDTVAAIVGVFVNTNAFRDDLPQYWNYHETRLVTPSNATTIIVQKATDVLCQQLNIGEQPQVGQHIEFSFENRQLRLYRMPSSSRAYPLAVERKAEYYRNMFLTP